MILFLYKWGYRWGYVGRSIFRGSINPNPLHGLFDLMRALVVVVMLSFPHF